jgi:hypothetical protein
MKKTKEAGVGEVAAPQEEETGETEETGQTTVKGE